MTKFKSSSHDTFAYAKVALTPLKSLQEGMAKRQN